MEIVSIIIAIISLLASLVTLFAVWGNISNYFYNCKNFKKGGVRKVYHSGEYLIYSGFMQKLLYQSSNRKDDFTCYRGEGMEERYEEIKPFKEWTMARKFDDIRIPNLSYSVALIL